MNYKLNNCIQRQVTIHDFQIATATLGFNVYEIYHASYMLKGLLAEPEVFTDFSELAGWSKVFQNCAGVSIFLGLIKIFKYISFNKTMAILSGTLTEVRDNNIENS